MLGLAVGDALGTTLEFSTPPRPPRGTRLDGPHRDITGGGPFHVVPGQVTDDTHMACCVAAALRDDGIDRDALIASYVAWAPVAFDIGNLTRGVIGSLGRGDREAGRRAWRSSGHDAAPNGSLMRTAPIGVRYADADRRRQAAFDDSALTHFDPRCQLACAAFDAAIAAAVAGATRPLELVEAAERELRAAAPVLLARHRDEPSMRVVEAASALGRDLRAARDEDPDLVDRPRGAQRPARGGDPGGFADGAGAEPPWHDERLDLHTSAGFVRVAFRLAFWELCHARGFEDGVIDVVNRGGDADTNGAIAGALLGAFFGADAIPAAWRQRVLAAEPRDPALRTVYHPRALLAALAGWPEIG